ncbi:hypothetical protein B5M44_04165 [Shinella sumterensis]|uniref:hypothetical protein n=1 Tax=Shinella TaxID=323620 RepID=UPI00106EAFCD|nr:MULTISPECIES: hypothetical protein [Shinella]MCD1264064.1 hypothetical protein [Shinella sumterensis]TFE99403.1 hypothetical protein B5M44_04165 [Shinella sumterensis]
MPIDHCAEAERLRALYTAIVSGDGVQQARFGEDEIRYFQADKNELKRLIAYHEGLCAGKRKRFAVRGGFRRY